MPVPANILANLRLRQRFSLLVLLLLVTAPLLARGPDPSLRIPLEPLGFQPVSTQFLLAGSSMLTLHYVDDQHLLVTFSTRRLLKRLPDDPLDDQDRIVEAVLLELPSGRMLGHTEWRLHDHGQYLWGLGHGRFLLRIRDSLTTLAPLANLTTGEPFRERPFIGTDRRIGAIMLSPDSDLLILETIARKPSSTSASFDPTSASLPVLQQPADPTPVQINLFRLSFPPGSSDQIDTHAAGLARSRIPGRIPATAEGYLGVIDQGRQSWAFDFNAYTGKTKQLSPFDSTCRPSPMFVSRSEFIAFGCHGSHAMQVLGAFNMRGEEMWEQTFIDAYTAPSFDYAPRSGRFALSRIIAHSDVSSTASLMPEQLGGQSVTVYQTDSGRQVLHVESQPVQRAGQNFALSPDGMSLAIIHADAIEIYRLPPLSPKEQAAVKEAQAMAPEANDAPINLTTASGSSSPATESTDSSAIQAPAANAAPKPSSNADSSAATGNTLPSPASPGSHESSANAPAAQSNASSTEDAVPPQEERRKPPTLYNSPSDPPPATTTQPK